MMPRRHIMRRPVRQDIVELGLEKQSARTCQAARVLVPVDHSPPAAEALGTIWGFVGLLTEGKAKIEFLHVGKITPVLKTGEDDALVAVEVHTGEPVNAILANAREKAVDLIAMPTAGHHGFLNALRGSTTERVIRHSPCPVLTVPVLEAADQR
jgi:hypothetical protein